MPPVNREMKNGTFRPLGIPEGRRSADWTHLSRGRWSPGAEGGVAPEPHGIADPSLVSTGRCASAHGIARSRGPGVPAAPPRYVNMT